MPSLVDALRELSAWLFDLAADDEPEAAQEKRQASLTLSRAADELKRESARASAASVEIEQSQIALLAIREIALVDPANEQMQAIKLIVDRGIVARGNRPQPDSDTVETDPALSTKDSIRRGNEALEQAGLARPMDEVLDEILPGKDKN